jgi:RecG-like helicase
MKKNSFIGAGLAGLLTLALALPAFAEDKEVTITGDGTCAKCALKETAKCQNAIQVEKDGKKVTYYLVDNDVSKKFHENLCEQTKKVTATGTVKEVDGKQQFTAKKIELAKKDA